MAKAIRSTLLGLALMAGEASAQFCPGLPPWVFDDVPLTHQFCVDITWLAQRGVSFGCSVIDPNHRLYCPADFVRRDQMAAFMRRLGDALLPLTCSPGQVMKWNGLAWACAADAAGPPNAFVQGGNAFGATALLGTTDARPLDLVVHGQRALRASYIGGSSSAPASINLVGGHPDNFVSRICSGLACLIGDPVRGGTVAGGGFENGHENRVTDSFGFVGGGASNVAGNENGNHLDATYAAVAGGHDNIASGEGSFVGGGSSNIASGTASVVSGGEDNTALGLGSMIPGGSGNRAAGSHSYAAGSNALANASGCFVWADTSSIASVPCNTANRFVARAAGGFALHTNFALTTGCTIAAGGGMWNCSSSRNQKEGVSDVDPRVILERVVTMPISTWRYRTETSGAVHLGPMAEDFHEAFGLGDSSDTIGTSDAQGVALAAIQGLNAKVEAQAREIVELRRAVESLLAR